MAKLPQITINISSRHDYTASELESLKKAFNVQLASIHHARKGEDDSPVGETNVSSTKSTKKSPAKSKKKSSAKKK